MVCTVIIAKPTQNAAPVRSAVLVAGAEDVIRDPPRHISRTPAQRDEARSGHEVEHGHDPQHPDHPQRRQQPEPSGKRSDERAGGVGAVHEGMAARGVVDPTRQRLREHRDRAPHQQRRRNDQQSREAGVERKADPTG
ncbi:MAG: hypothetical protein GWO40_23535 [Gammaproteobacteria bacterium]|nr:hypothetical protein [Gemmatimonadota bacterium]NIU07203.1 hypothetical protein [Gammaproteobacteria bacterium]NIV54016.1 hypothetical protein [Gammaproteobacteria bacterium]NIX88476.1 hypothetical protein [Gammaproteobacteria bacterium]